MFGSWKASSFVSSFSYLFRKIWNAWDVRGMVLLSLLLQITLFVLGKRRKYSVSLVNRMILWSAYITADWVAIVALGKLSNSHAESPISNILRALWAPLLILHLGGPDTITAYSFEDNQLWNRHILTLILRSIFAVYVIYLSWSRSWLSFLNLPLIFAGILKYVERILCLEQTNSKKTEPIINILKDRMKLVTPEATSFLQFFVEKYPDSKKALLAYLLFSVMRPDANDYLCHKLYLKSTKVRIETYLRDNLRDNAAGNSDVVKLLLQDLFKGYDENSDYHFDIATVKLGFIFDVVYTKARLIYTKKGCFLRFCSFTCSLLVLLLFVISIMNQSKFHFSKVDIYITISLLFGAVALEFCAVFSMVSSHWAVPLMLFHENPLVRKILRYVLQYLPCFFPQWKRWSGRIGQFNLIDYCWNSRKGRVDGFLNRNFSSRILENWYRFRYTKFVKVPSCLKLKQDYQNCLDSFFNDHFSFEPTRGEKTLHLIKNKKSFKGSEQYYKSLEQSIQLDFDTSIIVWHLATSVCYYEDVHCTFPTLSIEERESSKYLSDYMMYLLAMQPAILLPQHSRSFWLDACCDRLKRLLSDSKASNMDHAFTLLLKRNTSDCEAQSRISKPTDHEGQSRNRKPMENLQQYASNLVEALNSKQRRCRWELIKAMWIEILLYAAHSCQHINHVKQLGLYDREFITLIWVMGGSHFIRKTLMGEEVKTKEEVKKEEEAEEEEEERKGKRKRM